MLQAMLQIMLQGAGPVGYCPKVLKGVASARYCAYRAFCSWVVSAGCLCLRRFVPVLRKAIIGSHISAHCTLHISHRSPTGPTPHQFFLVITAYNYPFVRRDISHTRIKGGFAQDHQA